MFFRVLLTMRVILSLVALSYTGNGLRVHEASKPMQDTASKHNASYPSRVLTSLLLAFNSPAARTYPSVAAHPAARVVFRFGRNAVMMAHSGNQGNQGASQNTAVLDPIEGFGDEPGDEQLDYTWDLYPPQWHLQGELPLDEESALLPHVFHLATSSDYLRTLSFTWDHRLHHFFVGAMGGGKSTSLLNHVRQAKEKGNRPVLIFSPNKDTRSGAQVRTHDGESEPAQPVGSFEEMWSFIQKSKSAVVIIDEIHFYATSGCDLPEFLDRCERIGATVFAAGIPFMLDYRPMPWFASIGDRPHCEVHWLYVSCEECQKRPVFLSSRRDGKSIEQIRAENDWVGGLSDKYCNVCECCKLKGQCSGCMDNSKGGRPGLQPR
mmetsp:Transcript_166680/g.319979  ORF Transcript_166680/g.319979 Transcript_166680/m.319979 type:complete len:378 (+) Transcript_166680:51-1184(+)